MVGLLLKCVHVVYQISSLYRMSTYKFVCSHSENFFSRSQKYSCEMRFEVCFKIHEKCPCPTTNNIHVSLKLFTYGA
jgi:hypothetical protein